MVPSVTKLNVLLSDCRWSNVRWPSCTIKLVCLSYKVKNGIKKLFKKSRIFLFIRIQLAYRCLDFRIKNFENEVLHNPCPTQCKSAGDSKSMIHLPSMSSWHFARNESWFSRCELQQVKPSVLYDLFLRQIFRQISFCVTCIYYYHLRKFHIYLLQLVNRESKHIQIHKYVRGECFLKSLFGVSMWNISLNNQQLSKKINHKWLIN